MLSLIALIAISTIYALINSAHTIPTNPSINEEISKVIIDTDAGVDDALAIVLFLEAQQRYNDKFKVIAITCTHGNTEVDHVVENVRKTLTVAKRDDITVYRGAHEALINNFTADHFFGNDGFGDVDFDQEITGKYDPTKHAVQILIELTRQFPGEISILALGPLTNIALAMKLDAKFSSNVKRLYIMGGSVHGVGNAAPNVEYNFSIDPESNYIVFNSATNKSPIVLAPWETIYFAGTTLDWRLNVLGTRNSSFIEFLNEIERLALSKVRKWSPADAAAAAIMLWPGLVGEFVQVYVAPVIDGAAKGSLLIDYTNITGKDSNTEIAMKLDTDRFLDYLLEYPANCC